MKTLALSSHLQADFQGYKVPKIPSRGTREIRSRTEGYLGPCGRAQWRSYTLTASLRRIVEDSPEAVARVDEEARRALIHHLLKDLQEEIYELLQWSYEQGYDNDLNCRIEWLHRFSLGEPVEEL